MVELGAVELKVVKLKKRKTNILRVNLSKLHEKDTLRV